MQPFRQGKDRTPIEADVHFATEYAQHFGKGVRGVLVVVSNQHAERARNGVREGNEFLHHCTPTVGRARKRGFAVEYSREMRGHNYARPNPNERIYQGTENGPTPRIDG